MFVNGKGKQENKHDRAVWLMHRFRSGFCSQRAGSTHTHTKLLERTNSVYLQDTKSVFKNMLFVYSNKYYQKGKLRKKIPLTVAKK